MWKIESTGQVQKHNDEIVSVYTVTNTKSHIKYTLVGEILDVTNIDESDNLDVLIKLYKEKYIWRFPDYIQAKVPNNTSYLNEKSNIFYI